MSDSEGFAVTYTSVYTDSEPERVFWGTDEEIQKRDPEYEDDEEQDGPVDYPMGGGDDGGDDDGDSSGDDANDKDEDMEKDDEDEDMGRRMMRISVRLQAFVSLPSTADVERLLALPTPPLSPLTSLSPPSAGEHLARLTDPPVCLFDIGSRYDGGRELLTTRPTWSRRQIMGVYTVIWRRDEWRIKDVGVNTRVVELAKLHEHDIQDLHALLEDAQDGRSRISQRVVGSGPNRDHVYAHETHLQTHQTQLQLQSALIQTQHQRPFACQRHRGGSCGDMQSELLSQREQLRRERLWAEGLWIGLTVGIEKMESVFNTSAGFVLLDNQVSMFATCYFDGCCLDLVGTADHGVTRS
ncbi:hypothetical protein Tco_0508908 [Tanacetum coccineum]